MQPSPPNRQRSRPPPQPRCQVHPRADALALAAARHDRAQERSESSFRPAFLRARFVSAVPNPPFDKILTRVAPAPARKGLKRTTIVTRTAPGTTSNAATVAGFEAASSDARRPAPSHQVQSKIKIMLRYFTAGESHREALVAFLSGVPAGLKIEQAFIDRDLWRRQQGSGRGGRMKIERDTAHILSGVHHGSTIASPIAVQLENRDWKNWQESLPVGAGDPEKHKRVASPRPGHADLAGALKYNFPEARYVLERASARESASRVAIGALAKLLLRELGIEVLSHVIAVGAVSIADREIEWEQI